MALIFAEGFDWAADNLTSGGGYEDYMKGKYDNLDMFSNGGTKPGRNGGTALWMQNSTSREFLFPAHEGGMLLSDAAANRTTVIGFAIKWYNFPTSGNVIFMGASIGEVGHVGIGVNNSGVLSINRGNAFYNVGTQVPRRHVRLNVWYYMELKQEVANSGGSWEFRMDGDTVASASGVDTSSDNTYAWDRYFFQTPSSGTAGTNGVLLDDIYILDGTGSINNDFLGDIQVRSAAPDGDFGPNQWSPVGTGAANFDRVNENFPFNDDSSYLQTSTTGDRDMFDYSAVTFDSGQIHGVYVDTIHKAVDGEARPLITRIDSAGVIADDSGLPSGGQLVASDDRYMTTGFMQETDPNTGVKWTEAAVNAARIGFELG